MIIDETFSSQVHPENPYAVVQKSCGRYVAMATLHQRALSPMWYYILAAVHSKGYHTMPDHLRPPRDTPLAEFERGCVEEYKKTGKSHEGSCLEIIWRAMELTSPPYVRPPVWADKPAQDALVVIYTPVIEATMSRMAVRSGEAREEVAQEVWLRFWGRASTGELEFSSLGQFITYLKTVTVSCVIDYERNRIRHDQEVKISALIASASSDSDEDQAVQSFGEQLKQLLSDGGNNPELTYLLKRFDERCNELLHKDNPTKIRIFSLYRFGYPARDIVKRLIDEGQRINDQQPTPALVSIVLEQIFKRLQKDEEIRDLLQSD